MHTTDPDAIPTPRDGDFEDVRWALSAAAALWARGEHHEAIRWLRRGATAAAERGADGRSVELYKAAAELKNATEQSTSSAQSSGTAAPIGSACGDAGAPPTAEPQELGDGEADTIIRPETLLRRALMAIDPDYARRTAYDPDSDRDSSQGEAPSAADSDDDSELEETRRQPRRGRQAAPTSGAPVVGTLPALRVAVLPMPEDGDVRLLFLPPGAEAPAGVATALLVAPTHRDAQILARVYAESDAKL